MHVCMKASLLLQKKPKKTNVKSETKLTADILKEDKKYTKGEKEHLF